MTIIEASLFFYIFKHLSGVLFSLLLLGLDNKYLEITSV